MNKHDHGIVRLGINIITLVILAIALFIMSCCKPSEEGLQAKITSLKSEVRGLQSEVERLSGEEASLIKSLGELRSEERILKAIHEGKGVKYIIKFQLKQSHITLDPGVWMKDSMNKVEFEMPVDKEFYESVKKGQKMVDEFRVGSLIVDGNFGSWDLSVLDKRISILEK